MIVRLIDIRKIECGVDWGEQCEIRFLDIDGKSPSLDDFLKWRSRQTSDYKKILKAMKLLTHSKDCIFSPNHLKRAEDHPEIYYFRAHRGHSRMMFFYFLEIAGKKIAILSNGYWKTKSSKEEQDHSIQKAEQLRLFFLQCWKRGMVQW